MAHVFYATVEAWSQGKFYATVAESENRMSTIPTNRESDRFMLRLPDGMRDRIKAAAEANNRSMNAEIVAALDEKYPAPVDSLLAVLFSRIQELAEIIRSSDDPAEQERARRELDVEMARFKVLM